MACGKIANELLETMHAELKAGDENVLMFTRGFTGEAREKALTAHLAAKHDAIVELLTSGQDEEGSHRHG